MSWLAGYIPCVTAVARSVPTDYRSNVVGRGMQMQWILNALSKGWWCTEDRGHAPEKKFDAPILDFAIVFCELVHIFFATWRACRSRYQGNCIPFAPNNSFLSGSDMSHTWRLHKLSWSWRSPEQSIGETSGTKRMVSSDMPWSE